MCRTGNGVPRDEEAARRWYQQAVKGGSPVAEKRLQTLG
jgi:TPR repeat protein